MKRLDLKEALGLVASGRAPPIFVVHGDEFLCRTALQELSHALVPEASRSLNLIELDALAGPRQVAEEVLTLPMFRGTKVVTVQPAEFLASKKAARGDPFAKIRELWEAGKHKEASRRVLGLASRAGFGLADLSGRTASEWKAAGLAATAADLRVVARAVELALEEGLKVPESDSRPLQALLERGLPAHHHLLLAVDELDEKSPLTRLALEKGVELNRLLAAEAAKFGQRAARDLGGLSREVLGPLGKALSPEAARLLSRSPLEARALASELGKLAAYVGDRPIVEAADVRELIPPSGGEDLFALSNAVEARDKKLLLAAIDEELARGAVPLQLLGGLASAVRGLLAVRARLSALGIERRLTQQEFERKALPSFAAADQAAGRKPTHPFRAFKRAEAALRYSLADLSCALVELGRADAGIKRGMDGTLWLSRLALRLGA